MFFFLDLLKQTEWNQVFLIHVFSLYTNHDWTVQHNQIIWQDFLNIATIWFLMETGLAI